MTTVEAFDILVLGAGPAGISAARALQKEGNKSFLVLEARSRVGGRAYASDSLGVNRDLDHGARWIHGACRDNSMVKLLSDMVFDHPDDEGIEYEVCLPPESSNNDSDDDNNSTTPPFQLSEVDQSELIVKIKNSLQEKEPPRPTKSLTLILKKTKDGDISAQEPSSPAQAMAQKIFKDVIESAMDYPRKKLNSSPIADSIDEVAYHEASLLDLLLWAYDSSNEEVRKMDDRQKRDRFEALCRGHLVMEHPFLNKEAETSTGSEEEQQEFREEVMALFNLEIATVLESWEGSSLHVVSAKNGMKGTCLDGGNKILPFGYGGLVRRLAYPLIQGNHIRLQHEVVSVTTHSNTANNDSSYKVVVRCKVPDGTIQEFHTKAVIVALPLGVLRSAIFVSQKDEATDDKHSDNHILFEPQLPFPLVHAIQSLGITVRDKIELAFPHCFWPADMGRFTLACTHLQQSPTYHPYTTFIVESASASSSGPNILVCYVAGEFAKEMEQKSDETIQKEIMTVLRQANIHQHAGACGESHAVDIPDPIAMHVTRWLQDPYSRMSWTHYGKGSSPADVISFRSNEECRQRCLFFAGEHTCNGKKVKGDDQGCVHGAWVSGELAVEAALKRIS